MKAACALLLLACSACVQLDLVRERGNQPIADERIAALRGRQAELGECLASLGAPEIVWESPVGMAIAYAWQDRWDWDVSVQVQGIDPTVDGQTVFSFGNANAEWDGVVLIFDGDLRLQVVRTGLLGVITRGLRPPPALVE